MSQGALTGPLHALPAYLPLLPPQIKKTIPDVSYGVCRLHFQ